MWQKFNEQTLISTFIKNLLATTYRPTIKTVREGEFILKDSLYILRCNVIKCTKSGYISFIPKDAPETAAYTAEYDRLGEYWFGKSALKLSNNYVSNTNTYDSETHIRFGEYLRNLRDMYGLNLMPLYNCFSNETLDNHVIDADGVHLRTVIKNTKVYKVPIRFNQTYTICIDNHNTTTLAPAFLEYDNLLKVKDSVRGTVDLTNDYFLLHKYSSIKKYTNMSFTHPIKFRVDNTINLDVDEQILDLQVQTSSKISVQPQTVRNEVTEEKAQLYNKYDENLYLLIQVPDSNNSSIVVLEGDYSNNVSEKIFDEDILDVANAFTPDHLFTGKLKLMEMNTKTSYPFSENIIPYLLWHTVNNRERLNTNIDSVVNNIYPHSSDTSGKYSAWDNNLRKAIFDIQQSVSDINNIDALGYYDMNLERYFTKL